MKNLINKLPLLTLCLPIVALISGCQENSQSTNSIAEIRAKILNTNNGEVSVIAHRSCWQNAPENSLLAIKHCIASGVDIIEIDIRSTKDGQLVLLHDKTLGRTTNGSGHLRNKTLSEIKKLKLYNREGKDKADLTNFTIPTLDEVLELSRGKVVLNLDIKDDRVAQQAFDIVESKGMGAQILVKLREYPGSDRLNNYRFPKNSLFMPIIVQCGRKKGVCVDNLSSIVTKYKKYNPVAFELVFDDIEFVKEGVTAMQAMDARIWVNTMFPELSAGYIDETAKSDPDAVWGYLFSLGVNMIQTDTPQNLVNYLNQKDSTNK